MERLYGENETKLNDDERKSFNSNGKETQICTNGRLKRFDFYISFEEVFLF